MPMPRSSVVDRVTPRLQGHGATRRQSTEGSTMDVLLRDLQYAFRSLRKAPGFTAPAVLTLGLGIGAGAAVFSIVSAIYFAPLPFPGLDRLVMIETSRVPYLCSPVCSAWVSPRELNDWRTHLTLVDGIVGVGGGDRIVLTPSGPVMANPAFVSANFFQVLRLRPVLGRSFVTDDDRPGAANVVVLRYRFWMDIYGGDSSVIGRPILLEAVPRSGRLYPPERVSYEIVGVMSREAEVSRPIFDGDSLTPSFFLPVGPIAAQSPTIEFFSVIARLKPAVSSDRLRTQLDAIIAPTDSIRIRNARKRGFAPTWKTRVISLREEHARQYASVYPLMLSTVLLVIVIACINLAALFMARWYARRREIMVRAALGAGRSRLVRHVVTEGIAIAAGAVALGLLVAHLGVTLVRLAPHRALPYWMPVGVDYRASWFAVALATGCGVAFTLFPALAVTHDTYSLTLRDRAGAMTGVRGTAGIRQLLVDFEIACTLVLLTGAGLLAKTLRSVASADLGYAGSSVLYIYVGDESLDAEPWTSERRVALAEQLISRISKVPGVLSVS
ncbi:MAG TPA: ABC transporter permease, partial [Gemmatimonadaceae bacterium]